MKRTFTYYYPLAILVVFMCVDFYGYLIRDSSPIYWRAWEFNSNYKGKDANFAPFKPWSYFSGDANGDLLNSLKFTPLPSETRKHEFIVDEYGFRNRPGFLDEPVDAVVIGSSFVAGGMETQENLLSEILTNTYGIRTYNYFSSLQIFWEDERFIDTPPKYVLFVGAEGEIISSLWRYNLEERVSLNNIKKWNSFREWKKENEMLPKNYKELREVLQQFSLLRFMAIELQVQFLNVLYTRPEIARQTTQSYVTYYPDTGMMFWQEDYDIPYLGSDGKTTKDIQIAVENYQSVQQKLQERNIELIIVAMPSKAHIQMEKYTNVPFSKRGIVHLNQELTKANINNVDVFTLSYLLHRHFNLDLYFKDDSHWNTLTNRLIASQLAKFINEHEQNTAVSDTLSK